jgi:type IV pilus assembly protein PilQ
MNKKTLAVVAGMSRMLIGAVLASAAFLAHAQNAIEAVVGSVQGGTETVKIDLSEALTAIPPGFAIQSPARIALDFPGVANAMGRSNVEVNQGNLKSVTVVQAGDRTRVVLNLKQAATYKAQLQGKSLLVLLDAPANHFGCGKYRGFCRRRRKRMHPLRIWISVVNDSSRRLVVTCPAISGVDIHQQGQNLVVESRSRQPEARRAECKRFWHPVKAVTTTQW